MYFFGPVESEDEKPRRAPPPEDSVANRCKIAREHGKLTRWVVNAAAGLTRGHYGRIEDGFIKKLSSDTCRQLVHGFARLGIKLSLDWLLTGEGRSPTRIPNLKWNKKAFMAQQAKQSEQYRLAREQRLKKSRKKIHVG